MAYDPPTGGIYHLYATYILPSGEVYATYHLLWEPETTIDGILTIIVEVISSKKVRSEYVSASTSSQVIMPNSVSAVGNKNSCLQILCNAIFSRTFKGLFVRNLPMAQKIGTCKFQNSTTRHTQRVMGEHCNHNVICGKYPHPKSSLETLETAWKLPQSCNSSLRVMELFIHSIRLA